jgi:hypothetical protein
VDRVLYGAYVDLKEVLGYNINFLSYVNWRPYTFLPLYQPFLVL